jgi:hypothetical protein
MRYFVTMTMAALTFGVAAGCVTEPEDVASETYERCAHTDDCLHLDNYCTYVAVADGRSGNFCTHACRDDLDCQSGRGSAGACYPIGATSYCFQTCTDDLDCYARSVCFEVSLAGGRVDYVCLPDN